MFNMFYHGFIEGQCASKTRATSGSPNADVDEGVLWGVGPEVLGYVLGQIGGDGAAICGESTKMGVSAL
jgi:hypothetical protein